jgi:hypothetical protein
MEAWTAGPEAARAAAPEVVLEAGRVEAPGVEAAVAPAAGRAVRTAEPAARAGLCRRLGSAAAVRAE